jgi:hypothetical protein
MTAIRRLLVAMLFVLLANGAEVAAAESSNLFTITTLSSHPELVTGGDALIRIDIPAGVDFDDVVVTLNGEKITGAFHRDDDPRTRTGLVEGLEVGENELVVDWHGPKSLRQSTKLRLVNYRKDDPVFSGPYQTPFACEEFILPVIGTRLPKGTPPECSVDRQVHYFYKPVGGVPPVAGAAAFVPCPTCNPTCPGCKASYPADVATTITSLGVEVKYIVRMEVGSANRGVYTSYMLHDPILREPEPSFMARPQGWNGRLIYNFGAGCSGGWYRQGFAGTFAADSEALARFLLPVADIFLSRGYAATSSTLNRNAVNCNDVIAAATMAAVKERFIEAYGPPKFTMGFGFSGGAMQQQMIADNYPGLLDGIVPGASFPDSMFAYENMLADAALLDNYFRTRATLGWTEEQKRVVTGLRQYASALSMVPNSRIIDPRGFCPATLPPAERYDPVSNPSGVRCDIYTAYANVFGISPQTGFARRPIDNVGVQYGLAALNARLISPAHFLELNEKVGGVDVDGNLIATRTLGDQTAIQIAYRTGRMTYGGGGLAAIPIIDYRSYSDDQQGGDHHLRHFSFAMRQRLELANGHGHNHVMLIEERGPRTAPQHYNIVNSALLQSAFWNLDRWLENLLQDTTDDRQIEKLLRARPPELREGCMTREPNVALRTFVAETQTTDPSTICGALYPVYSFPRGVAGERIASDGIKCQLKAIEATDYGVVFTGDELAHLNAIFPGGVCDRTKPGFGQQPPDGTWISFGPAGIEGEGDYGQVD